MRQEIVRKQNETKQEQARKEQEKRELLESLESDKPEPKAVAPKQNLTPLFPPAALIPPRFPPKIFSPVSNMLAIERAKRESATAKSTENCTASTIYAENHCSNSTKGYRSSCSYNNQYNKQYTSMVTQ